MAATAAEAQVEKKCYRNNTAGWLGVVKLDHLGAQVGHSIEPYGQVWLTDNEATLTARAPRDPKDNPFEEQIFQFYDEAGKIVSAPMRPLVLIDGERYDPANERFVPRAPITEEGEAAAAREAQEALAEGTDRHVPQVPGPHTPIPASGAAVPPSHAKPGAPSTAQAAPPEEKGESWLDPEGERTLQPQQGSLSGSSEPAPGPVQGDPMGTQPTQAGPPPQQPAPGAPTAGAGSSAAPGAAAGAEEHAAFTKSGEETGAAETPAGQAPEGEFASHEEVGSPDAPTQAAPSEEKAS